ncbi:MAG: glycosyltransferase family 4 protein [Nitrospirae bacterium]|nr:glycosyltransferase family 4 protein [Nitrospirota bacterium]
MPADTKVIAVERAWWHFSAHSGYAQFIKYLDGDIDAELLRIPEGRSDASESLIRSVFARCHYKYRLSKPTTINDILAEYTIITKVEQSLKDHERVIVHFLDGEHGYNRLVRIANKRRINRKRFKVVATYHQPPAELCKTFLRYDRLSDLDMVIVLGSNQVKYFSDYGVAGKLRVIPHGVDVDFFTANTSGIDQEYACITVGHWLRDFRALNAVIESSDSRIRFHVVAYPEVIEQFGFKRSPRMVLHTGISDEALIALYRSSMVGFMPLLDGVANNSILEMMSVGLPIVTTDVGAVREYTADGTAVLCANGDVTDMRNNIERLVFDDNLRLTMGRRGRERALSLSWRNVAKMMSEAYKELFEGGKV